MIKTKIVNTARDMANFINFLIKEIIITIRMIARMIFPSAGRFKTN
jgi:hypothetical protein